MTEPVSHHSQRGIHWLEQGPAHGAPVVVLIHGLGGDAKFWTAEQAALAQHFRVLAVDLRGSGLSTGFDAPFSIEDLASDIVSLLDELGIASAHVAGFSLGGVVAQAVALAAPTRVARLVLAATFSTVNPQARLFLDALARLYAGGASPEQMYDLIVPWLFSERFLSEPRAEPFLTYVEDPTDKQTTADWLRLLDAMLRFDARARLGAIAMPTLIISGDEDRLASANDADALHQAIPGSAHQIMQGGHLMNVESPEAFISALRGFLLG